MTSVELDLGIEAGDVEEAESLSPVATDERSYGRYLLQYEIASGGMASVYLARSLGAAGFERPIAIKRIHPHLAKKPVFVDMFLDEARLNARIAHPNVCNVFDFGEADGSYFMAMEYLVGQPLSRVLGAVATRQELLSSTRWHALAARILADACQGLHAAHELLDDHGYPLHVVHRDFTPHNVFVTYDGAVKVFDFGVARAEGRLHQTETGMLKGKLAYMSPEQLARAPIDRRLDVWAAGVCLWELLTLRRLFGRRSELETVQAIASDVILEPSKVRTGVPRELDAIAMRALDRDVDRRTASARLLARELNQYISTTGITTSMSDVAELMAELFPEERARKLDVVANVLKSEDALALDANETSAVQRSRGVELRSTPGSLAAPRLGSRFPVARAPTPAPGTLTPARRAPTPAPGTLTPARREPTPAPGTLAPARREPTPAPGTLAAARRDPTPQRVETASVSHDSGPPEEATTRSTVDLADMLEPPSETSLSLRLDPESLEERPTHTRDRGAVETLETEERDTEPPARRVPISWMLGAAAILGVLGLGVFVVVVSGALESTPTPPTTVALDTAPPSGASGTTSVASGTTSVASGTTSPAASGTSSPAASGTASGSSGVGQTEVETGEGQTAEGQTAEGQTAEGQTAEGETERSEEAERPVRAARGSINVAARGGWADLFVDGRPAGRTPRSVPLPEGRHLVELRPPGGAPIRRFVTVRAGRTQRVVIDL
jgi:serine/threonine protein kinase